MKAIINNAVHSYDIYGSGPYITLIHSVGLSTRQGWRNQFEVLTKNHTVLNYDIRGLGESEKGDEPVSVKTFVKDLKELLSFLRIEKTVLMGTSLGGCIAQEFTIEHSEFVQALILVSTTCKFHPEGIVRQIERNKNIRIDGMKVAVDAQINKQFPNEFIRQNPEVIEWYQHHYLANDPETYIEIMDDLSKLDLCEGLQKVNCPTLIITGEQDMSPVRGDKPLANAKLLNSLIKGSELVVMPNSHHYPHIDQPETFNLAIKTFLDSLSKKP